MEWPPTYYESQKPLGLVTARLALESENPLLKVQTSCRIISGCAERSESLCKSALVK